MLAMVTFGRAAQMNEPRAVAALLEPDDDLREAWGDVPAVPAVVESSDPDPVPPGALRSFLRWLGEEA